MSKLFFDHLVVLTSVDAHVKSIAETAEEREELWQLVDELVHHRIMDIIFGNLPEEHHTEFMEKFTEFPYEERLFIFLNEKAGKNFEKIITEEMKILEDEILTDIKPKKKKK
ncbi:MAG: hypothetical protein AAB656_00630 [Patescibacteria group bacterium]